MIIEGQLYAVYQLIRAWYSVRGETKNGSLMMIYLRLSEADLNVVLLAETYIAKITPTGRKRRERRWRKASSGQGLALAAPPSE